MSAVISSAPSGNGLTISPSGKQEKLLQALTRGLEDVALVEPWTTSFNPGTTTLERLLELARPPSSLLGGDLATDQ